MKLQSLLFLWLALAMACCCARPAHGDEMRKYLIKSGVVEYKLSGTQTGSMILSFDRWGLREARETKSETRVGNIAIKNHNLVLLDGDWTYTIDLEKKTGTKMPTPQLPQIRERMEREGKDLAEVGREMLVQMGGKKVGEEKFLGKPCEVWEVKAAGTRMWVWQGVPLKTTAGLLGQTVNTVAVRVEENPTLSDDRFTPPSGVTIAEGKSPLDLLKGVKDKTRPRRPAPK